MAWCPDCRTQYREGVERCADCGSPLVEDPGPEPEAEWDPVGWVTVEETGDEVEARIIEGYLLEREIPVRILSRHDHELPTTVGELSTVEVQVPEEDLDRAIAALEEVDGDDD